MKNKLINYNKNYKYNKQQITVLKMKLYQNLKS